LIEDSGAFRATPIPLFAIPMPDTIRVSLRCADRSKTVVSPSHFDAFSDLPSARELFIERHAFIDMHITALVVLPSHNGRHVDVY